MREDLAIVPDLGTIPNPTGYFCQLLETIELTGEWAGGKADSFAGRLQHSTRIHGPGVSIHM